MGPCVLPRGRCGYRLRDGGRRPFLYLPLRDHCEQNFHVKYRLDRYRAGRCMDFDDATSSNIASAIESLVSRPVDYLEVETGTAARAATLIAELL